MSTKEDDPVAMMRVAKFREGLAQLGWREGQNLQIEWRWSGGDIALTRRYADELVQLAPDVLLGNGTPATVALKQATTTIPIVFSVVNDPVSQGIISSMAHPGGNITGFSFLEYSMVGKSLEMLKRIAPQIDQRCDHVQSRNLSLLRDPPEIVRDSRQASLARTVGGAGEKRRRGRRDASRNSASNRARRCW